MLTNQDKRPKPTSGTPRRQNGNFIAETPAVIWCIFVVMLFPFIDLATLGLRSYVIHQAARNGAAAAVRCQTFETPLVVGGTTYPPAREQAVSVARETINPWPGVRIVGEPRVEIRLEEIARARTTVSERRLTTVPDTSVVVPMIRVTLTGEADPLVTFRLPFLSDIPGLSAPVTLTTHAEDKFENVSGLVN